MIAASSPCSQRPCETCASSSQHCRANQARPAKTAPPARMGWTARTVLAFAASLVLMAGTVPMGETAATELTAKTESVARWALCPSTNGAVLSFASSRPQGSGVSGLTCRAPQASPAAACSSEGEASGHVAPSDLRADADVARRSRGRDHKRRAHRRRRMAVDRRRGSRNAGIETL